MDSQGGNIEQLHTKTVFAYEKRSNKCLKCCESPSDGNIECKNSSKTVR
jgi:hypothetical protein